MKSYAVKTYRPADVTASIRENKLIYEVYSSSVTGTGDGAVLSRVGTLSVVSNAEYNEDVY